MLTKKRRNVMVFSLHASTAFTASHTQVRESIRMCFESLGSGKKKRLMRKGLLNIPVMFCTRLRAAIRSSRH